MPNKKIIIISSITIGIILIGSAIFVFIQKDKLSGSNSKTDTNQSYSPGQNENITLDKDGNKIIKNNQSSSKRPNFDSIIIDPKTGLPTTSENSSSSANKSLPTTQSQSSFQNQEVKKTEPEIQETPNLEEKIDPKTLSDDDNTNKIDFSNYVDDGKTPNFVPLEGNKSKYIIEDLTNFKFEKFKDTPLLELEDLLIDKEGVRHLFATINGRKEFLGYGVNQVFDVEYQGDQFHVLEFRDSVQKPRLLLTNKDFGSIGEFVAKHDIESGLITQINNTIFRVEGNLALGDDTTRVDEVVDFVQLYIFTPED